VPASGLAKAVLPQQLEALMERRKSVKQLMKAPNVSKEQKAQVFGFWFCFNFGFIFSMIFGNKR
jgi:hypothetical protein